MKAINYEYAFNYDGDELFRKQRVLGASIDVEFRGYKNGREVSLLMGDGEMEMTKGSITLSNLVHVRFDRSKLYVIEPVEELVQKLKEELDLDEIRAEASAFSLAIEESEGHFTSMQVQKSAFFQFIWKDVDGFDISDNKSAQVTAYVIKE